MLSSRCPKSSSGPTRDPTREGRFKRPAVTLIIPGPTSEPVRLEAALLDISRRGFLCELHLASELVPLFAKGSVVRYDVDERLDLGNEGQIRHLNVTQAASGVVLQLGIEAGIGRKAISYQRISLQKWQDDIARDTRRAPDSRIESRVVRFPDRSGRQICGHLNATRLHVSAPVVIIPSAYGKKKEALSPLVAALISSFHAENRDIVTLRYDGINRPGESHQDNPSPKHGYEMLAYRTSEGINDLQAAIDYVHDNPHFVAEKVILISFSMSALDTRRLLSEAGTGQVDLWISCMGVPASQTTLRNILAGIDITGNYRLGVSTGILGLLGHLIEMDIMAADLIRNKYAFMTDARLDMARIGIPILWIYGLYDKWVDVDEVKDLMSVKANSSRDIFEIPTGHNLRTSQDAIHTFKLIAGWIHQKLYDKSIVPCDPPKDQIFRLLTAERERLSTQAVPSLPEYWQEYLLGNVTNAAGYDFYRNIPEFTSFMKSQADALSLAENEIVADMGCGTGIFVEQLLELAAQQSGRVSIKEITAVDLVQAALDKTRVKCNAVLMAHPELSTISLRYLQRNLEPNRLIPVKRFVDITDLPLEFLRNKIPGLSSKSLDRLIDNSSPDLFAALRGLLSREELLSRLQTSFDSTELQGIVEFNRAARFLENKLTVNDLRPEYRSLDLCADNLRCDQLIFDMLRFADSGRALRLDFPEGYFTKIVASLFISYVLNPEYVLSQFYQMLVPGGTVLLSSMKPDTDLSMIFTNYTRKLQTPDCKDDSSTHGQAQSDGARAILNEAASLFQLEEDGLFRFYTAEELSSLLEDAGFVDIAVIPSLGEPHQAYIATARK